jgi:hypothetical protein
MTGPREGAGASSHRHGNTLTRGVMPTAANDTLLMQEVSVWGYGNPAGGAGEQMTAVEHWQPYGHTHNPLPPTGQQYAEMLVAHVAGSRSHPIVIGIADRRYRLGGLQPGETGRYDNTNKQSVFHTDGHYTSVPNSQFHQHRVQQAGDDSGTLTSVPPYASGRGPWKPKIPHSYKHIAAALMQNQHPQQINHHIISGLAIPPQVQSALTALSGTAGSIGAMAGQMGALATAGVGVPAINTLGSQIVALAAMITGTGVTSAMTVQVGTITTGATTAAGASSTTGIATIATTIQSAVTQLTKLLGGGMSSIIHKRESSLISGLLHAAFQGQHTTTHNASGITHTSSVKTSTYAPIHYRDGPFQFADSLTSGPQYAPSYNVDCDARLKSDVVDHEPVLEKLMALKVKKFNVRRLLHRHDGTIGMYSDAPMPSFGLLADDALKNFPLLVHDHKGYLRLNEGKVGIMALQGLQEFVVEMRAEIAGLKHDHARP